MLPLSFRDTDIPNQLRICIISNINGWSAVIKMWPEQYAFVDNDHWHKIAAVAPNTFVALDRQLKMEIKLHEDGGASGWLMMALPSRQLSGGEFVPEKIVSFAMR